MCTADRRIPFPEEIMHPESPEPVCTSPDLMADDQLLSPASDRDWIDAAYSVGVMPLSFLN